MAKKGVDVSEFQGNIEWDKVKADGIEFAIIKLGNIYDYDANYKDSKFENNYKNARTQGIKVGAYIYNYCNSVDTLKKGLKWALENLGNKKLDIPIYLDMEDKDIQGETIATLTNQCNEFAKYVKSKGYQAGVYANINWLKNELNPNNFDEDISVWVAQYYKECEYTGKYDIWQYASDGKVDGISGNVDMNYYYGKLEETKPTEKPEDKNKHHIDIDGKWGEDTTRKAQEVFKTTVDGIVTDQYISYKSQNPGLLAFEWLENPSDYGSELIRSIQKKVGANIDGHIGPETIKKIQKYFGTVQDGYVSNPSDVVKEFQKWLNEQ